jgi:hypothetical protein
VQLRNLNCPYCGAELVPPVRRTKEHVIGRRFVPKGVLDNSWNVILGACEGCNQRKAVLEDCVAAASLHMPMPSWTDPDEHALRRAELERRAVGAIGSGSERQRLIRRDRQPQTFKVEGREPNLRINVTLTGPPRVPSEAVAELAQMQVASLVHFATFDRHDGRGRSSLASSTWSTARG